MSGGSTAKATMATASEAPILTSVARIQCRRAWSGVELKARDMNGYSAVEAAKGTRNSASCRRDAGAYASSTAGAASAATTTVSRRLYATTMSPASEYGNDERSV